MSNADLVKSFYGKLSSGDIAGAAELCTADSTMTIPGAPTMTGREAFQQAIGGYATAFPGFSVEVGQTVEEGDHVAIEGVWKGTNSGPMMMPDGSSMPATGKMVTAPFASMFTVKDGKIAAHSEYWDLAGFMGQLQN